MTTVTDIQATIREHGAMNSVDFGVTFDKFNEPSNENKGIWNDLPYFVGSENVSIFLHGNPGTGKTIASKCLLNQAMCHLSHIHKVKRLITTWPACVFVSGADLRRGLAEQFGNEKKRQMWRNCIYLAIDDWDKAVFNVREMGDFHALMSHRMDQKFKTIFTMNIAPKELGDLFSRGDKQMAGIWNSLRERMLPVQMLHFTGKSLRTKGE